MTPWRLILGKAAFKTLGAFVLMSIGLTGIFVWQFVYNTDNQFGHIIVALIVGLLWIIYAIVMFMIGAIMVASE